MDPKTRRQDLNQTLIKVSETMKDVAVRGFNMEQAGRIYYTAISRTPKLLRCTNESLARCLVDAASLGLFIGGTLGQCYAVPFKNKNLKGEIDHEATFILGYQGMVELMRRSGEVESVTAELVHENDLFVHQKGLNEKLDHIPLGYDQKDRGQPANRGKVTHGYCIVKFKGGGHHVTTMAVDEINLRRARSRAKDDGPWVTDWNAMARKTLVRATFPFIPKTPDIIRAIALDDDTEDPPATAHLTPIAAEVNLETGEVTEDLSEDSAADRLVDDLLKTPAPTQAAYYDDAPIDPEPTRVDVPVPQEPPVSPKARRSTKAKPEAQPAGEVPARSIPDPPTQDMFPRTAAEVDVDLQSAKDAVDKLLQKLDRGHRNVLVHTFNRKHGLMGWAECKSVKDLSEFYEEIDDFMTSVSRSA